MHDFIQKLEIISCFIYLLVRILFSITTGMNNELCLIQPRLLSARKYLNNHLNTETKTCFTYPYETFCIIQKYSIQCQMIAMVHAFSKLTVLLTLRIKYIVAPLEHSTIPLYDTCCYEMNNSFIGIFPILKLFQQQFKIFNILFWWLVSLFIPKP